VIGDEKSSFDVAAPSHLFVLFQPGPDSGTYPDMFRLPSPSNYLGCTLGVCSTILLAACARQNSVKTADAIWFNGPILTIVDARPQVESVAIRDGRILAAGDRDDLMKLAGADTRLIDLQGHTLLPGFIDAHGHVSMAGLQALSVNLLPPPDGPNADIADLQATLREAILASRVQQRFGVVLGFGYDDSQLRERRHPTRDDLDAVSRETPILIIHQSGHLGVLNGKALEMAGISAATPDPQGGLIRRRDGSREPDGVLEELSFFGAMSALLPAQDEQQAIEMLEAGQESYLSHGYTTMQDGRSSPSQVKVAIAAAKAGRLKGDVITYPDITQAGSAELLVAPWFHDTTQPVEYRDHLRIGGVKLTLDGSPQGKTAWLSKPYYKPPDGKSADYAGYGVIPDAQVVEYYTQALRHHWQILTHANGDRAIDQMLDAMRKAQSAVPGVDVRPALIHGQTLRKDQVAQLQSLHIFPSLFPMHTFYWGDWHRESVLGPDRAEDISPTGWILERGMMFTSHHDTPVVFPDSIRVLSATVNRTTRSGHVLGPQHRVEPAVALKSLTLWAAWQYFEEASKGSIEPGKLADFVVLSGNPLTVPREKLIELRVLETIKEGKTVYVRSAPRLPQGRRSPR
jgi:predicted amidohydrolase YtcJ